MTRSYKWHDSFIYATWLARMGDTIRSYKWHDSFIYATWLAHVCVMTRSFVRHDSLKRVTWLVHMCNMTRSNMWRDARETHSRVTFVHTHEHIDPSVFVDVYALLRIYRAFLRLCGLVRRYEGLFCGHTYAHVALPWVMSWYTLCGALLQDMWGSFAEYVGLFCGHTYAHVALLCVMSWYTLWRFDLFICGG